jgi:ADP-ribose pyrophosphatase
MPARIVLAEGKHLRLVREGPWEYAERTRASGAVVLVAVTADGCFLLTEQYRVPLACQVIELPAGLTGDDDGHEQEPADQSARRELLEETGYEAREMKLLTIGPPTAGLANEVVSFFLATGLTKTGAGGGIESEEIVVYEVALAEVPAWLEQQAAGGMLIDPKVYAGLFFADREWKEEGGRRKEE